MKPTAMIIAAILASASAGGWSQGVSWPVKPVRFINPVAPGGNQDIVARAYAEQLARALGQPFVVESRPGNSAIVGTRHVKSAPPDGYTVLTISNTFVRTPAMVPDAGYDPIRDFVAISQTSDVPLVLVVNPALPVKSVKELIALAKRRPGELTVAASGSGSTGHVAAAMFSSRAGIKLLNVQYKGAAPAVIDLVGGHVMLRFDQVTTSLPFIRSEKLRPLGVTTISRSAVLPDVPTIHESGLPGFNDSTFNGLVAPAGTAREIVERLRAEVARTAANAELRGRFAEQGNELVGSKSSEEFGRFLRRQTEEFAVLARQAGITAN